MALTTHCKTLHPADYDDLREHVAAYERTMNQSSARFSVQHQHRRWESAIALSALAKADADTVLEVGSGGSPFAATAAAEGYDVTVCDPDSRVLWHRDHPGDIRVVQADFIDAELDQYDAVVCLSVLEHVEDDTAFFKRLCDLARSLVVVTVDFSMDGRRYSRDHLRTYSPKALAALRRRAPQRFVQMGESDWRDNGAHVYDYNFASLVLVDEQEDESADDV